MKKKSKPATKKASVHKTKVKGHQTQKEPHANKATKAKLGQEKRESFLDRTIDAVNDHVKGLFSKDPSELTAAIKKDHEGLRNYLDVLKDTDRDMTERKRAYVHFSELLKSHSRVEERIAYKTANEVPGYDMHIKVAEGYVEHRLADKLMAEIERTTDPIEWSAHTNVLSEIVKHHLDEEERTMLPRFRKAFPEKLNQELLADFLKLRAESQEKPVTAKNAGVLKSE